MAEGNGGQGGGEQAGQIRAYEVVHNIHGNLLLFVNCKLFIRVLGWVKGSGGNRMDGEPEG